MSNVLNLLEKKKTYKRITPAHTSKPTRKKLNKKINKLEKINFIKVYKCKLFIKRN